ncbi:MAG: iron transporter [candidate division NC10 bacterium]|nr:iron transporter [candidate division NC10 bacterium]
MRKDVWLFLVSLLASACIGSGWPTPASGQTGPMGGPRPGPMPQTVEPTEHGTKTVGDLEITLVSALPLSQEQMAKMMPGIGPMGGMPAMPSMGPATHWIGVIVHSLKDGRVVPDLQITLTAQKRRLSRTVTLMPMPGSYGANISLPEKGRYKVTVTIARPVSALTVTFELDNK